MEGSEGGLGQLCVGMEKWGGTVDYFVQKALLVMEERYLVVRVQQVSDASHWAENEGILFILLDRWM